MLKQNKTDLLLSSWGCLAEGEFYWHLTGLSLSELSLQLEQSEAAPLAPIDCLDLVIACLREIKYLYKSGNYSWNLGMDTVYYNVTTGVATFCGEDERREPWESLLDLAQTLKFFFDSPSGNLIRDPWLCVHLTALLNDMARSARKEYFHLYAFEDAFRALRERWLAARSGDTVAVIGFLHTNEFYRANELQREAYIAALSACHQVVLMDSLSQLHRMPYQAFCEVRREMEMQGLRVRADIAWYEGEDPDVALDTYRINSHATRYGLSFVRVSAVEQRSEGRWPFIPVRLGLSFDRKSVEQYRALVHKTLSGELVFREPRNPFTCQLSVFSSILFFRPRDEQGSIETVGAKHLSESLKTWSSMDMIW